MVPINCLYDSHRTLSHPKDAKSMSASNKQIEEHNNSTTIWEAKIEGKQ